MANFNFNKVMLGGRMTADPELRQTSQGTSVTSFSVAVNRRRGKGADAQQVTDFINCVAWGTNAEFITKYFHRGSSICVVGSVQTRTWTDQQGQKRYATEVNVEESHFVDSKSDSAGYSAPSQVSQEGFNPPAFSSDTSDAAKFEEISSDDDLPF